MRQASGFLPHLAAAAIAAVAFGSLPAAGQDAADVDRVVRAVAGAVGASEERLRLDVPASGRFAIVIGNSAYENVPSLENAAADARAMAAFLRTNGFRVIERHDLSKRAFEDLLRQVLIQLSPDSEVLFYYAGHGIQIGRRNYLLPADAELSSVYDTPFETVTLDSVISILAARSRLQLVILDSCRNNPFADAKVMTEVTSTLFEARDGFNPMSAPLNTLLAYSTSPGRVALDGDGANSPFTEALLRIAQAEPDESIGRILETVRRDVYASTDGQQVPWESSTLVEPFRFGADRGVAVLQAAVTSPSLEDASAAGAPPTSAARDAGTEAAAMSATLDGGRVVVEGPLERHLALGAAILDAMPAAAGGPVTLAAPGEGGRLTVAGADGRVEYRGEPLTRDRLAGLVYEYAPVQKHATGSLADYAHRDSLSISVAGGAEMEVALSLTPDPCDLEAGDWLDPDGVGLARYPNEIEAERALEACRAAVAEAPDRGRFHYQLGRALQALRRYDEAKAAFERARDLGHTRAWFALGDLLAEAGAIEGGRTDTEASDEALDLYITGVRKGDPYAYHALGKQLLRHGDTEAARRYGFELLSRALELGHTFSMNELGYYFLKPDSPDFEPQRGLRYLRESAARNDIYGFHNLGLVYDAGLGGIQGNPQRALEWYERAAAGGHPHSPINIGRMYYQGKLGDSDALASAIAWYDRGLERGAAWGGANAAWIIANEGVPGYTRADAAIRAAKAMALQDAEARTHAEQVLASLDDASVRRAVQSMLGELGEPVTVDGVIGPETHQAVDRMLAAGGVDERPDDARGQLVALARVFWKRNSFRIDLY